MGVSGKRRDVNFNGYDGTLKRWYPKVARTLSNVSRRFWPMRKSIRLATSGRSSMHRPSGPPSLIEQFNAHDVYRIIRFAARDWSTVDSSIADAVNQLASVLVVYTRKDHYAEPSNGRSGCRNEQPHDSESKTIPMNTLLY